MERDNLPNKGFKIMVIKMFTYVCNGGHQEFPQRENNKTQNILKLNL